MKPNVIAAWIAHFIGDVFYYIGAGAQHLELHRVRNGAYAASEWFLVWASELQGDDKRGPYRTWSDDE
jgi:hypothetical protein